MPSGQGTPRDALPNGTVLRDYKIEAVLGHGGFGIVYRARHNEVGHIVALKEFLPAELLFRDGRKVVPRSSMNEAHYLEALRRFRDEARALINLPRHPNVIGCRDFFRAHGTAYLVMDFVDGQPLSELLREREAEGSPLNEAELLAVAVPLVEGLAHVHRAGIFHRDVKPANILIQRTDGTPVLVDFGAAKQVVAEHTRSLAPYTEGYAALEQVSDGKLGPWTDMYAVGAVMWRVIAGGNRPWEPPNPTKVESRASALVRQARDPLPSAQELGADRFSSRVLTAVQRCLMVREADRVRNGNELLRLLKNGVSKLPDYQDNLSRSTKPRPRSTHELGFKPQHSSNPIHDVLNQSLNSRRGVMAILAVIIVIAGSCMPAFSDPLSLARSSRVILDEIGENFGVLQKLERGSRSSTYYVSRLIIGSAQGKFIVVLATLALLGVLSRKKSLAWIGVTNGIIWTSYWLISVPSITFSWLIMLAGFFLMIYSIKTK